MLGQYLAIMSWELEWESPTHQPRLQNPTLTLTSSGLSEVVGPVAKTTAQNSCMSGHCLSQTGQTQ